MMDFTGPALTAFKSLTCRGAVTTFDVSMITAFASGDREGIAEADGLIDGFVHLQRFLLIRSFVQDCERVEGLGARNGGEGEGQAQRFFMLGTFL
jgi:hypothetical protein